MSADTVTTLDAVSELRAAINEHAAEIDLAVKSGDARLLTAALQAALAGTSGTPGSANKFVTQLALDAGAAWTTPAYLNSWTGGTTGLVYSKDALGIVRLRGQVQNVGDNSSPIFLLPAGFRPPVIDQFFSVPRGTGTTAGRLQVNTTGNVIIRDPITGGSIGSNIVAYLDGVSFPTW